VGDARGFGLDFDFIQNTVNISVEYGLSSPMKLMVELRRGIVSKKAAQPSYNLRGHLLN
jgi:hypothetical protein